MDAPQLETWEEHAGYFLTGGMVALIGVAALICSVWLSIGELRTGPVDWIALTLAINVGLGGVNMIWGGLQHASKYKSGRKAG